MLDVAIADLSPEKAEILQRSIAMLPPQAPRGLARERALAILGRSCGRRGSYGAAVATEPLNTLCLGRQDF